MPTSILLLVIFGGALCLRKGLWVLQLFGWGQPKLLRSRCFSLLVLVSLFCYPCYPFSRFLLVWLPLVQRSTACNRRCFPWMRLLRRLGRLVMQQYHDLLMILLLQRWAPHLLQRWSLLFRSRYRRRWLRQASSLAWPRGLSVVASFILVLDSRRRWRCFLGLGFVRGEFLGVWRWLSGT